MTTENVRGFRCGKSAELQCPQNQVESHPSFSFVDQAVARRWAELWNVNEKSVARLSQRARRGRICCHHARRSAPMTITSATKTPGSEPQRNLSLATSSAA